MFSGGDAGVVAHSSQLVIQPCAWGIQTQDAIIQYMAAPLNQVEHFRCLLHHFARCLTFQPDISGVIGNFWDINGDLKNNVRPHNACL